MAEDEERLLPAQLQRLGMCASAVCSLMHALTTSCTAHDDAICAALASDTRLRELVQLVDTHPAHDEQGKVRLLQEAMQHNASFTTFVERCLDVVHAPTT